MARVSNEGVAQFWEPIAMGPIAQVDLASAKGPGATIAASTTFDTGLIYGDGFKTIAAAVKMNQAGTLTITRYLDEAGLLQQGAAGSVAVTANTTTVLNVNDGLPYASLRLTLANSAASPATIAAFAFLLNAN